MTRTYTAIVKDTTEFYRLSRKMYIKKLWLCFDGGLKKCLLSGCLSGLRLFIMRLSLLFSFSGQWPIMDIKMAFVYWFILPISSAAYASK